MREGVLRKKISPRIRWESINSAIYNLQTITAANQIVNLKFTKATHFENLLELDLFDILEIPLHHVW
jgi:hypothetical protein